MSLNLPEVYVGLDSFDEPSLREHAEQVQRNFEAISAAIIRGSGAWTSLSFLNGWRSYLDGASAYGTAGVFLDSSGIAHLHGLIDKNGGNFAVEDLFSVPSGFRPVQRGVFAPRCGAAAAESAGRCDITTAGVFTMIAGGPANPAVFVTLDGISWRAEL